MLEVIVFVAVSTVVVIVSWPSLFNRRTHGFYRFFAFEVLLILFLLNVRGWFREPFSAHQIASWLLLLASLFLVVHGFYLLRTIGKPSGQIENTTRLVKRGAYRYIRHPLYSSLLFFGWGTFLKDPSLAGGVLGGIATALLVATARVEERENVEKFGAEYEEYIESTKMFIPFLL